jgi:aspartyl/glutamyl-tRNA(Asn/Gln) amidotransferase C subunit
MDIDIKKFADLAKIKLNKEEEIDIQKEVSVFLDYVNLLDDIGKKNDLPIMDNVTGLKNVYREDIPKKYEGKDLLKNAPLTKDGFLLVPKVIKQDKE